MRIKKFLSPLHEGPMTYINTLIIGPTRIGMSAAFFDIGISPGQAARINPIKGIKENTDFVMDLLVGMSGMDVADSVRAKARVVAIAQAEEKSEVTILDLVNAFDQLPELLNFSLSLRKAALPGPFGKYLGKVGN